MFRRGRRKGEEALQPWLWPREVPVFFMIIIIIILIFVTRQLGNPDKPQVLHQQVDTWKPIVNPDQCADRLKLKNKNNKKGCWKSVQRP